MSKIKKKKGMKTSTVIFIVGLVIALATLIPYFINNIQFNRECGGHLRLASNANSVEIAANQLEMAIMYAENNHMTEGFTSIFYETPADDVGFWYTNIKSAQAQLAAVDSTNSELEKSNILIKLRETLLDHTSKGGDELSVPNGLARYPHNFWWGLCCAVGTISGLVAFLAIYVRYHD